MRTPRVLSIGCLVGFMTGVCLTTASVAEDRQAARTPRLAKAAAVASQIEKLANQIDEHSKSALGLLVRSRGLQAKRPRAKDDEDSGALAERMKNLVQWISDIDAMQSELRDHRTELESVSERIMTIRKLEMTDDQIVEVVNLELGVHTVVRWLQRGTRELDLAKRRGTNALDGGAGG